MLNQLALRVPVLLKSLTDRKLNAIELLVQDHLKVEMLFMRFKVLGKLSERVPSRKVDFKKRREQILIQVHQELVKHMAAEEHIFYPECEARAETRGLALEAFEEHQQVKNLLKDLIELSVDRASFEPKFTLLIEDVMHHVREEEEKLFPIAKKLFSASHLIKMGSQIRTHKKQKQTRRNTAAAA